MKTEKRSLVTWSAFIATLIICIILSACSASAETNEKSSSATSVEETNDTVAQTTEPATASKTIGSMDEFKTNMENSDYYVQKGSFAELDTVDLASKGKLLSCFGNNAGSVYTVLYLPPAPEQDNAKGNPESPEARVKADIEAINRTLPNYKQILRLEVTDQPLEKTTTGKIKRQQKQQKH